MYTSPKDDPGVVDGDAVPEELRERVQEDRQSDTRVDGRYGHELINDAEYMSRENVASVSTFNFVFLDVTQHCGVQQEVVSGREHRAACISLPFICVSPFIGI